MTTIDISKDLPETLSNWDLFVSAYYSQVGTVIKFVKIDDHHWSILKETEREMWTVGKWSQVRGVFFPFIYKLSTLTPFVKWLNLTRNKEQKAEAFYLVDIPVQAIHVRTLRENPIIDAFSYSGRFCLTQYIKK